MSRLKNFLDRRSENLGRKPAEIVEKNKEELVEIKKEYLKTFDDLDLTEEYVEEKTEAHEEDNPNLSDHEFWTISNRFLVDSRKNSDQSPVAILQKILEGYTPLKIKQFAVRYEELNK